MANMITVVFKDDRVVDFEDAEYWLVDDDDIGLCNKAGDEVAYLDKSSVMYMRVVRGTSD